MLTYVLLFIGMASAIVGVLLRPRTKSIDGSERFNRWVFLFVALPVCSFATAAWKFHSESMAREDLSAKLEESIDRVDAFEVIYTYELDIVSDGFSKELKPLLVEFMNIYSEARTDDKGEFYFGLGHDSDVEVTRLVESTLDVLRNTQPAYLFVSPERNVSDLSLLEQVAGRVSIGSSGSLKVDLEDSPKGVAIYYLLPPRENELFPPAQILASEDRWIIPDKNAPNPKVLWFWRYRLAASPHVGLRLLRDFRAAQFVALMPRINPDLDESPSMAIFEEKRGRAESLTVSFGGTERSWDLGSSATTLIRSKKKSGDPEEVGYLGQLDERKRLH